MVGYTTADDVAILRTFISEDRDPQAWAALDRIARRDTTGPGTWIHRCGNVHTGDGIPAECGVCALPGSWERQYR